MIQCPNCGGNLKFDVTTQDMGCEYCDSHFPVESVEKEKNEAVENDYFETTVFTCPQCNGEMYSTDTDATAFCSFCGASNILHSRIEQSRKPKYILPFTITKDDCKEAYIKATKKAFFTPKEMRDINCIDSFRGIYMPYWYYEISQKGPIVIKGEISDRRGDYIYHDHYDLTGNIDAKYNGISYDAASSFSDNISQKLAPFDANQRQDFNPGFLSGYYADIADVDSELYEKEAMTDAYNIAKSQINALDEFRDYDIKWSDPKNNAEALNIKLNKAETAMYPVWFMSYRNKDRVAYAAVNGQTGKVIADLPVDKNKYVMFSFVWAIPLFFLLNLMFTLTPFVVLNIITFLSLAMNSVLICNLIELLRKDNYMDDKGRTSKSSQDKTDSRDTSDKTNKNVVRVNGKPVEVNASAMYKVVIAIIVFFAIVGLVFVGAFMGVRIAFIASIVINAVISLHTYSRANKVKEQKSVGMLLMTVSSIFGLAVGILNPVSDLFYYGVVIMILVSLMWEMLDLISYHNILTTRPLPQFNKQGGDDRA